MAHSHPESVVAVHMNVNSKKTTAENIGGTHRAKGAANPSPRNLRRTDSLSPIQSTHITVSDLGV